MQVGAFFFACLQGETGEEWPVSGGGGFAPAAADGREARRFRRTAAARARRRCAAEASGLPVPGAIARGIGERGCAPACQLRKLLL